MDTILEHPGALSDLMARLAGDEKHGPSATSTLDVLWVLYDRILNVSPEQVDDPLRDRFLLSKGHGPQAFYAVLAKKGFLDPEVLSSFGAFDSPLGNHPDRLLIPGVEISSGSLGHGLPIALGVALGLRARSIQGPRVVCLLGDGELDEGSNHEAIAVAGRLGVTALHAVVIDNGSSTFGWPGGIASRFELEGWWTRTVDGRDHEAVEDAFLADTAGRPRAVVAEIHGEAR